MISHKNTLFQKLQRKISGHVFNCAVSSYLLPNSASCLTHRNHFDFMMYCVLNNLKSLREGVFSFNFMPERIYHVGFRSEVKLSTISEANKKRDHRVFQTLFENLLMDTRQEFKNVFAFPLYILDSSTITFQSKHTSWAKHSSKTDGIKVHLQLDAVANVPVRVEITNGKVADITVAKKTDMEPGSFHMRDRAYWDSEYLHKQHRNGAFFIIRAKTSLLDRTIKQLPEFDAQTKCSERILQLMGPGSQEYCDHLRAVQIYDENKDEYFEVFTNNLDLPAESIAELYKNRWKIELFFKW